MINNNNSNHATNRYLSQNKAAAYLDMDVKTFKKNVKPHIAVKTLDSEHIKIHIEELETFMRCMNDELDKSEEMTRRLGDIMKSL